MLFVNTVFVFVTIHCNIDSLGREFKRIKIIWPCKGDNDGIVVYPKYIHLAINLGVKN